VAAGGDRGGEAGSTAAGWTMTKGARARARCSSRKIACASRHRESQAKKDSQHRKLGTSPWTTSGVLIRTSRRRCSRKREAGREPMPRRAWWRASADAKGASSGSRMIWSCQRQTQEGQKGGLSNPIRCHAIGVSSRKHNPTERVVTWKFQWITR